MRPFQGSIVGFANDEGLFFDVVKSDPIVSTFGTRSCDMVLLGCVRGSRSVVRHGSTELVFDSEQSGLVLIDCDRPTDWNSAVNDVSYLAIPRSLVRSAAGRDVFARQGPVVQLPQDGLTPILRSHLDAMTLHAHALSPIQADAALSAAGTLAYALLAALRGNHPADDDVVYDTLFIAALRQIDLHLHDASLTAERLATAVGCSRAHLYRVFSRREQSVAGALRTARLRRARSMLRQHQTAIGLIAFHCGYTDVSAFGKAFKQHFGIVPSAMRQQQAEASARHQRR